MNQHQQFIQFHEALMKLSHHPDFIRDSRQGKLTSLTSLCGNLLKVGRVSVWHLSKTANAIQSECLYSLDDGHDYHPTTLSRSLNPRYFGALLQARVISAPNALTDERTRGFSEQYLIPLGIVSMLDAPVFDAERLSGAICLEAYTHREWSLAEISFVTAIADTVSLINTYEAWSESQEALEYIIHYDDLTGLPNLRSLRENLVSLTQGDNPGPFSLLWIDLDRMKLINDGMGQSVGNQILQHVADRLRHLFPSGKDKIARSGGDEFVILLRRQVDNWTLKDLASNILELIAEPILIGEHSLKVTASIGISRYPNDGDDANALLKHSEAAMYYAKESGRSNAQFFNTEISADARSRFLLESQLRLAIVNHELEVYYQPIVRADDQKMIMLEALVRWNHPTRGILAPHLFLDLAHSAGLMSELGESVLQTVCRHILRASETGRTMPVVAINLASEQLLDIHLPERIGAILSEYNLSGEQFDFEVIEDVIKSDSEVLRDILQRLVGLGAQLSIDDFGTGYSSLARLKHLPFSKLKIDRSFICDLPEDTDDCAITLSILGLARGLGLSVVAEGVETEAQEKWLQHHGCGLLQGYRYSRPIPFEQLMEEFF